MLALAITGVVLSSLNLGVLVVLLVKLFRNK